MIGFAVFAAGVAMIALTPRSGWIFAAVLFATLAAQVFVLGQPRPHALGFPGDITVVAAQFVPDEAIWLWSDEPVAYELPWSTELAAQIMGRQAEIEASGEAGFAVQLGWGYGETAVRDDPPMGEMPK